MATNTFITNYKLQITYHNQFTINSMVDVYRFEVDCGMYGGQEIMLMSNGSHVLWETCAARIMECDEVDLRVVLSVNEVREVGWLNMVLALFQFNDIASKVTHLTIRAYCTMDLSALTSVYTTDLVQLICRLAPFVKDMYVMADGYTHEWSTFFVDFAKFFPSMTRCLMEIDGVRSSDLAQLLQDQVLALPCMQIDNHGETLDDQIGGEFVSPTWREAPFYRLSDFLATPPPPGLFGTVSLPHEKIHEWLKTSQNNANFLHFLFNAGFINQKSPPIAGGSALTLAIAKVFECQDLNRVIARYV
jgi:hypothetical protein